MTIRKRLVLSNLMMILVPVLIAAIIGSLCIGIVFEVFRQGVSFGLDDSDEFYFVSQGVAELAEHYIKDDVEADTENVVESLLDSGSLRLEIWQGDTRIYAYGEELDADRRLIQAASCLGENGSVAAAGNRRIFSRTEYAHGVPYQIYVLGTLSERMGRNLKIVIVTCGLVLILAVLGTVFLTNRILTKFVFRRIEEPLEILMAGVREIGKGNLEYRIAYDKTDEFRPACDAFNDMAQRLKRSVAQIQQNEESRKELLAGISHDLRSPLTSIKAYVEGLLDDIAKTPDKQREYLLTVQRKAEDIDRMVNQLFAFSKLELDDYPMELQKIRLDQELFQIAQDYRDEYMAKGLLISAQELAPCAAMAEREQLRRIIRNVMDNSAKYKTAETGHLTLSLRFAENRCELRLADDGPGVSEEALPKLFDVFYRTDPARRNPSGGSGLGLAIAAKAAVRMDGHIYAENNENGGLSILMILPGQGAENGENSDC